MIFYIFYKKKIDIYFKFKNANKLAIELEKLINKHQ